MGFHGLTMENEIIIDRYGLAHAVVVLEEVKLLTALSIHLKMLTLSTKYFCSSKNTKENF